MLLQVSIHDDGRIVEGVESAFYRKDDERQRPICQLLFGVEFKTVPEGLSRTIPEREC